MGGGSRRVVLWWVNLSVGRLLPGGGEFGAEGSKEPCTNCNKLFEEECESSALKR